MESLCANDLQNYSDAKLLEYVSKHRQSDNVLSLPLDGWEELQLEQQNHLFARLKNAQAKIPPHPLDPEDLETRLRALDDGDIPLSVAQVPDIHAYDSDSSTRAPNPDKDVENETEAHDELLRDGGRPLYPVTLVRQVLRNPDDYLDILRPFWGHPESFTRRQEVFQRQLQRWKEFRHWQRDNRGLDDPSDAFATYVEEIRAQYTKLGYREGLAKIDSDPNSLGGPDSVWAVRQEKRDWLRQQCRESGCNDLGDYEAAAKARLARHGFDQTFRLHNDPAQQSASTTWIEYLCFEYWWQDWHTDRLARLEPGHDAAYRQLRDAGLLEPDETAEFLRTPDAAMRRSGELCDTQAALLAATTEVESILKSSFRAVNGQSGVGRAHEQPGEAVLRRRDAAQAKCDFAQKRADRIYEFLKDTDEYQTAKHAAENQPVLAAWVKEQMSVMLPRADEDQERKRKRPVKEDTTPASRAAKRRGTASRKGPPSGGDGSAKPAEPAHPEVAGPNRA